MVAPDGSLDLYHGVLRARDADGQILFDQVDYQTYDRLITEEVKPWSYMKFPYFTSMGPEAGLVQGRPARRACRTATASPRRLPSTSAASSSPTPAASRCMPRLGLTTGRA